MTDSKSLTYFIHFKKQPNIVARWILNLQDFNIEVTHITGKNNPADFLSRHVVNINISTNAVSILNTNMRSNGNDIDEQIKDSKLKKIINMLTANKMNKVTQITIL